MRQRARVGDVVVSPLHARALKIGTDNQIRKLLVLNFAETAALVSRPRRSAMATRILLALGTAVAVALVRAGTGGLGFVNARPGERGHQSAGGSTRGVRQSLAPVQRHPRQAACADRCQASAAESSGAGRLPRPHQGYEHPQGPHRCAAIAHRSAQQVRRSGGLLRCRHLAADRGIRRPLPRHPGAADRRAGLQHTLLGTAIARAKGLDAGTADAAGRISLGPFFAETNGNQNIGRC